MRRLEWWAFGILSGAAAALASPATAQLTRSEAAQISIQTAAPPPAPDVVVTAGSRPGTAAIARQAQAITRSDNVVTEPLPRYQTAVCPGIVGLPREIAELIVDRIRYDAKRAGIRLAHENKCYPNLLVVVTRNGQADLHGLAQRHGYLLANLESQEIRDLLRDASLVHAWNNLSRRGRHGEVISHTMELNGSFLPELDEPWAHSKIYLTTRLDIDSGVVLFDVAAVNGLSVNQIADYAAMRGLANTRPAQGGGAAPTILSLFDGTGHAPLEMTEFDQAYLRETYSNGDNIRAYSKLVSAAHDTHKGWPAPRPVAAQTEPTPTKPE